MNLNTYKKNDFTVVVVEENRLDAAEADVFKEHMLELIEEEANKRFIIDLTNVQFMDSSGLGAVVAVRKVLTGKDDHSIALANPQSAVNDLFDLTCMDKVFSIYDSVDQAFDQGK